jgi:hypothetical protein
MSDYKSVGRRKTDWVNFDPSCCYRSGSEGRRHQKRMMVRNRRLDDKIAVHEADEELAYALCDAWVLSEVDPSRPPSWDDRGFSRPEDARIYDEDEDQR